MIAILKKGHATAKDLSFGLKDTLFDPKLADELNLIADHKTTPEGSFFKLKDDSGFHCFLPILTMPSLIDLVDMNHQKALVFPIKKNCEFVNGFHVPSFSKTVLSIVFSILHFLFSYIRVVARVLHFSLLIHLLVEYFFQLLDHF